MRKKFTQYKPTVALSDSDIVLQTKNEMINYIFRQQNNANNITIYYFNKNEEWTTVTCKKLKEYEYDIPSYLTYNITPKSSHTCKHIPRRIENTYINKPKFKHAIMTLKIGDTLDTFIKRYNELLQIQPQEPSDVSEFETKYPQQYTNHQTNIDKFLEKINTPNDIKAFILAINNPIVIRYTDNTNTKTFDIVKIDISIPMKQYRPDRLEFIKKHQKELIHIALMKIANSPTYKKYNIPINYLKVDKMVITAQSMLEITFVLKQLNT